MKIHPTCKSQGVFVLASLLVFSFIITTVGCQKALPSEDGPPVVHADTPGSFDLADSNSCADIALTGIYLAGQPVTGNASIELKINVTDTGAWKFTTDTLNGISFSGSGRFAAKGVQTLTLYAYGQPLVVGNTIFPVRVGINTYYFSLAVLDGNLVTEAMPAEIYFKGTIGGVDFETIVTSDPVNSEVGLWGYGFTNDTVGVGSGIGPIMYPNPPGTGSISLQINYLDHYQGSTDGDFKNFLSVGSRPFMQTVCRDYTQPGILISWNDSNSNFWNTYPQMGDQTGSKFQIVSAEDGHSAAGKYFIKIKAKFNCKLYKYPSGEMQELTNGEMVCHIERYE